MPGMTCGSSSGEITASILVVKHFATEDAGETRYVAGVLELKAKSDFAAGEEGYIEQAGFNAMIIEPRPHLLHDDAQVCGMAPDLNNVHYDPSRRAG
jgi:hypothetical protein